MRRLDFFLFFLFLCSKIVIDLHRKLWLKARLRRGRRGPLRSNASISLFTHAGTSAQSASNSFELSLLRFPSFLFRSLPLLPAFDILVSRRSVVVTPCWQQCRPHLPTLFCCNSLSWPTTLLLLLTSLPLKPLDAVFHCLCPDSMIQDRSAATFDHLAWDLEAGFQFPLIPVFLAHRKSPVLLMDRRQSRRPSQTPNSDT